MSIIYFALLTGCGNDGGGEVFSKENAPWSMNSAGSFLFKPARENDGNQGTGILAIGTSASLSCSTLGNSMPNSGSGLWFEIGYVTGRSAGSASPAWNGLYVSGEGVSTQTNAARTLVVSGWHKGFSYSFTGTDAWLDVTDGAQNRFVGDFSTQWWTGKFSATRCEDVSSDTDDDSESSDTGDSGE